MFVNVARLLSRARKRARPGDNGLDAAHAVAARLSGLLLDELLRLPMMALTFFLFLLPFSLLFLLFFSFFARIGRMSPVKTEENICRVTIYNVL